MPRHGHFSLSRVSGNPQPTLDFFAVTDPDLTVRITVMGEGSVVRLQLLLAVTLD